MGPRHSKRSLDMAGTPTKSEIEGVGNVGKLEKISDGIVEKVSANGHVDGELQNGAEPIQNGLEPVQNGEAAAVAVDNSLEKIRLDEKEVTAGVNGEVDDKLNGEVEDKAGDVEGKDEKKEKKKEKKEKVVKKKFSFRSFSFSKKDKSKPKEEKAPEAKEKAGIEESPEVLENNTEENVEESKEAIAEPEAKVSEPEVEVAVNEANKENIIVAPPILVMTADATFTETGIPEISDLKPVEKIANTDDLPPPLPASPPPTEIKEAPVEIKEGEIEVTENVNPVKDVESFAEIAGQEPANEVLTTAEHIEEKAAEEKVEECNRNDSEASLDDTNYDANDDVEINVSSASDIVLNDDAGSTVLKEVGSKLEPVPEPVSSIVTMSSNAEEATEKQEEFGAGESLAEIDGNAEPAINTNEVMVSD